MRVLALIAIGTTVSLGAHAAEAQQIPNSASASTAPVSNAEAEEAFALGRLKYRGNDMPGARSSLQRAVSLAPGNTKYLSALGMVYLRTGEGAKAVAVYTNMCELTAAQFGVKSPRLWGCYTLLGNASLQAGNAPGASTSFSKAYANLLDGGTPSAIDRLMTLSPLFYSMNLQGRGSEVVKLYEQLLVDTPAADPYRPEVEKALGLVREGKTPRAMP